MLVNEGALAEHLVGQMLRTAGPRYIDRALFYWTRQAKNAQAAPVRQREGIATRGSRVERTPAARRGEDRGAGAGAADVPAAVDSVLPGGGTAAPAGIAGGAAEEESGEEATQGSVSAITW